MQSVTAYIAHQSRGRLRLRVPERKNNTNSFISWQNVIEQWPQAHYVETNPATGSILIHHDGQGEALLAQTSKLGFVIAENAPVHTVVAEQQVSTELATTQKPNNDSPFVQIVSEQFKAINSTIKELSAGYIDLPSLLFFALLLQGLIQFMQNPALIMPWDTAWWFALNVFLMIRSQSI